MNSDLISAVGLWFSKTWELLTSTIIPGTNISAAVLLIGPALIGFSISLLGKVFDINFQKPGQAGGNNKRIKVSDERKGDSH